MICITFCKLSSLWYSCNSVPINNLIKKCWLLAQIKIRHFLLGRGQGPGPPFYHRVKPVPIHLLWMRGIFWKRALQRYKKVGACAVQNLVGSMMNLSECSSRLSNFAPLPPPPLPHNHRALKRLCARRERLFSNAVTPTHKHTYCCCCCLGLVSFSLSHLSSPSFFSLSFFVCPISCAALSRTHGSAGPGTHTARTRERERERERAPPVCKTCC